MRVQEASTLCVFSAHACELGFFKSKYSFQKMFSGYQLILKFIFGNGQAFDEIILNLHQVAGPAPTKVGDK